MPCYNSAQFVERTLESVRAQTSEDWELVVVDDGSTDDPTPVLTRLSQTDPRIRFERQMNGGVCAARNRAFAASNPQTKYLLFLDADDTLQPTMLERLSTYLDRHSEVGMVYCERVLIDAADRVIASRRTDSFADRRWTVDRGRIARIPPNVPETPFASFFAWNGVVPSVTLIRRTAYMATPGFDEVFGQHFEETDVFFAIALLGPIHYLPEQLVNYRVHSAQAANHQDAIWAKERVLYRKWLMSASGRTANESALITDAWDFRERTLMPRLRLRWAMQGLRCGQCAAAFREALRALNHLRSYYHGRRLLSAHGASSMSANWTE